jgi:hypothetical protein
MEQKARNIHQWAPLVLGVTVAFGLGLGMGRTGLSSLFSRTSRSDSSSDSGTKQAVGPWGKIEYAWLNVAPPAEYIGPKQMAVHYNSWHFANMDRAKLIQFLAETGVDEPAREKLLAKAMPMPEIKGMRIAPDIDDRRNLSPSARAKLYLWLSDNELNADQSRAYRFTGGEVRTWLRGVHVRPEILDDVETLVYRYGPYLFFADLALIIPKLNSDEERQELVRGLNRQATIKVRLEVAESSNADALVRYWGTGRRATEIRPLIESLSMSNEVDWIDVVHLLPPFARERLYRYPDPIALARGANHNCYWSAFNFFNRVPDDRFNDQRSTQLELDLNYHPVTEPGFGDLVMFETEGQAFHAANYIAGGIVFTKNGNRSTWAWIFKPIDQVKYLYPKSTPVNVRYYRKNEFGA